MLYVECYPDEALARSLGIPRREIRHEKGKGNIMNRLRQMGAGTGLVDEDPDSSQANELKNYVQKETMGGLIQMAHRNNPKIRLIVLCPRLEDWLLARATASCLDPNCFGLSAEKLRSNLHYERWAGFPALLQQLQESDPEMKRLYEWITQRVTS